VLLVVALGFAPFCAFAEVSVPDTPAGHTLQAFLDAFVSGDHDRIAGYVKEYDPQNSAERLTSFSSQTGGFILTSIVHSAPDRLTFLVHGRGDNIDAYGVLQLVSTAPPRVRRLSIRALPPGAKLDDIQLDPAVRQKTIDAISARLTEGYVYPDVAAKMVEAVQEHQKKGDYNAITDGNDFADAVSRDLRAVSHDQHLFLTYNPFTVPEQPGSASGPHGPSPAQQAAARSCCGGPRKALHNLGSWPLSGLPRRSPSSCDRPSPHNPALKMLDPAITPCHSMYSPRFQTSNPVKPASVCTKIAPEPAKQIERPNSNAAQLFEVSLQLLDALDRLEAAERNFQRRFRSSLFAVHESQAQPVNGLSGSKEREGSSMTGMLLTEAEVADRLRVSLACLRRWRLTMAFREAWPSFREGGITC
jgi:hypothetical protein